MRRLVTFSALIFSLFTLSLAHSQSTANLRILIEHDSFTVIVVSSTPISIAGLQFLVLNNQNQSQTISFEKGFPVLRLTTDIVNPGA